MTTRPSNPGPCHPASDREALSALFDGELVGDVARFALKRLDHDQDWRATCERWQSIGDVLRNRNTPMPATFPSRVRAAVHADARHAAMPARARHGGLRWGSAALVASAAVVAVFLAGSPFGDGDAPVTPEQVAVTPEHVAVAPAPESKPQFAAQAPAIDLDTATAAVAVAAVARPAQRSRNLQRDRAATDRIVSSVIAAHSPITAEVGPPPVAEPIAEEIALNETPSTGAAPATGLFSGNATGNAASDARPWPRAVLPQYSGSGGALAADFATAPSFYPFVPATQGTQAPEPGDEARSAPAGATTNPQSPPPPLP